MSIKIHQKAHHIPHYQNKYQTQNKKTQHQKHKTHLTKHKQQHKKKPHTLNQRNN